MLDGAEGRLDNARGASGLVIRPTSTPTHWTRGGTNVADLTQDVKALQKTIDDLKKQLETRLTALESVARNLPGSFPANLTSRFDSMETALDKLSGRVKKLESKS